MDVTRDGETFPFTYSPTDPEEVSVAVRSLLARGEYEIAPYDAPSPPVPQSVSSMQAKVALSRAGLLQTVEAWVASESGETRLIWNSATVFSRESGLIASAAAALGLTSEQVDDLFRSAAIIDP
jgi:hypothetical protein